MKSAWSCSECHETAYITERLEERIEWRRLSDQGRERVIKVRDLCKKCLYKSVPREIRGQGSLLT